MFIRISLIMLFLFACMSSAQANYFSKKMDRMEELQSLIKLSKEDIKNLMNLKKKSDAIPDKTKMARQIDIKHKNYTDYVDEFNLLKEELIGRFPDRVDQIKAILSGEQKTNGELEQEMELEARLDKFKAKIDKKYKALNRETASQKESWKKKIEEHKIDQEDKEAIEFVQ